MFMKRSIKRSKWLYVLLSVVITFIPLWFCLPTVVQAATTLTVYPAPSGIILDTTFTAKVRANGGAWQDLDEYQTRVGGPTYAWTGSFVYFDCDGPVDMQVTYNGGTVSSAIVQPSMANQITPTISGNTVTVTLSGPKKCIVEVNGNASNSLHVFANPLEVNPPKAGDANVTYLAPGVYNQNYTVGSGQTLYLAGGAVIKGSVNMDNASNAKFIGRGVIDHPSARAISADYAKGLTIDGIIVNDYGNGNNGGCLCNVGNSQNVTLNNVKGFSFMKWTDGIDVFASTNTTISDCFIRSGDDCIAVYTSRQNGGNFYWGNVNGVSVSNCILMPEKAHPINIGTHGDPTAPGGGNFIQSLSFQGIDILEHNTADGGNPLPIEFTNGDGNFVNNCYFQDIRMLNNCSNSLFNINNIWGGYNTAAGNLINNVYFKNFSYSGTNNGSTINGYDSTRLVKNVTFENLMINGAQILSASAGNVTVGNNTSNIKFVATGGASYSPVTVTIPAPTYTNLALNKTASADSTESGYSSANGLDGNTTTRWCANDGNTGHWWKVDLGASKSITGGTQVMWETAGKAYWYKVETSTDDSTWTTVVDKTANDNTAQTQTDYFQATARYVRITVTGLQSGAWASLYEFKVLG